MEMWFYFDIENLLENITVYYVHKRYIHFATSLKLIIFIFRYV